MLKEKGLSIKKGGVMSEYFSTYTRAYHDHKLLDKNFVFNFKRSVISVFHNTVVRYYLEESKKVLNMLFIAMKMEG